MNSKKQWVKCLVLWLVVVLPGIGFGGQQELSGVIAAWQQRQARTQTAFYRLKVKHWLPRGTYGKNPDVPEKDTIFEDKYEYWLDFVHNYNRKESWVHIYNGHFLAFYQMHQIDAYDGEKFQTYQPLKDIPQKYRKEPFTELSLYPLDSPYNDIIYNNFDFPLFFAHGVIASDQGVPRFKQLRFPIPSTLLEFRGKARKAEREYLIIRTKRGHPYGDVHEYWVDPNQEGTIVHYKAYTHKQKLYAQLDIVWQQNNWGFVPQQWHCAFYQGDHLSQVKDAVVDTVQVNLEIPMERFRLSPPAGTIVSQSDRFFQVAPDGQTLEPYRPQERLRSSWPFYGIALILLLLVLGLLLMAKYKDRLWRQT
jgi:hypothetical protein